MIMLICQTSFVPQIIIYLFVMNCNKYVPCIMKKVILYTQIIYNCTITSAPGHEHGYNGLWYDRMTGFIRTDLVSHT